MFVHDTQHPGELLLDLGYAELGVPLRSLKDSATEYFLMANWLILQHILCHNNIVKFMHCSTLF
jgi:hypothetical protein